MSYYTDHRERRLASAKKYREGLSPEVRADHSSRVNDRSKERRQDPEQKEKEYSAATAGKYGISKEEAQVLRERCKSGTCDICGLTKRLHIDHDHETNAVRGLLCVSCNTALGKFMDSADVLDRAAAYLRRELP